MRSLKLCAVFLFALGLHAVSAQIAGTVGIQTTLIPVFTAQTSSASSGGYWQCSSPNSTGACPVFQDFGFGANYLTFCTSSFIGSIDLEWSPSSALTSFKPLTTWTSPSSGDTACHTLQVGGYFPNLRSSVAMTSGSISAWYTASAAPIPLVTPGLGSNGPTSPVVCDQAAIANITTGSTNSVLNPTNTGDTVVICGFSVSFNGATSAGSLVFEFATSGLGCTSPSDVWAAYTTASTPQIFVVPNSIRSSAPAIRPYFCIVNSSGATANISLSWASVHL